MLLNTESSAQKRMPDILDTIANLSSDEVFTPPKLANQILDILPPEVWSNPDLKWLDPACKTGIFLREIARRLMVGLQTQIPDEKDRREHILKNMLHGMAITSLTGLMTRRTLYTSKKANSKHSVAKFEQPEGNIIHERIEHTYKSGHCVYCGVKEGQYDRGESLENYAYNFIHNQNLNNMKFDVIIGNPPYQISDGGNAASAAPIYHKFVQQAIKLNPKYISFIIPSRWFAGGKGLDEFRTEMLGDKRIKKLVDFPNAADCFPGVSIAGGVMYFLWDKSYHGMCEIFNHKNNESAIPEMRNLNEFPTFIRDNTAIYILRKTHKVGRLFMDSKVFSRNSFGLSSDIRGKSIKQKNDLALLSSKGISYISGETIIDKEKIIDKYKVVITYAMSGGHKPTISGDYQIISSLSILDPLSVCTETYLVLGVFEDKSQASNLLNYIKTKFCRFLLLQSLSSIHITKSSFQFVPVQNFTNDSDIGWSVPTENVDKQLYAKYGLDESEIAFIESLVRDMK